MNPSFDPNFLSELIDQSHNPPGNDPVLGSFYAALVELAEEKDKIAVLLMKVKKKRSDITYKHLVNLIFRAYQAIKLKENDLNYRNFNKIRAWKKEFNLILKGKNRKYFEKLLLTKSTTTTIYQRYAGPFALISLLYPAYDLTIADLGCGGNYGLRGLELKEPFKTIQDLTSQKIVNKLLQKKINLKMGLAVDKEDPNSTAARFWRIACSFYPHELDEMKSVLEFENKIKKSNKVQFFKINLLKKAPPKIKVNLVILSTVLYQLNLPEQLLLINRAKKSLSQDGFLIVQDFAVKNLANARQLDFNDSWFGKKYSYRTFITAKKYKWNFMEIFQWNNGRCRIVKDGEDLNYFVKTSRAALAHSTS